MNCSHDFSVEQACVWTDVVAYFLLRIKMFEKLYAIFVRVLIIVLSFSDLKFHLKNGFWNERHFFGHALFKSVGLIFFLR